MEDVLQSPRNVKYLRAYVKQEFKKDYGNLAFLLKVRNEYNRMSESVPLDYSKNVDDVQEARGRLEVAREPTTESVNQDSSSELGNSAEISIQQSANVWDDPFAKSVSNLHQENGIPPLKTQKSSDSLNRKKNFFDILPVGAASSSSANALKEKRNELSQKMKVAFQVLQNFLSVSRSTTAEAKAVTYPTRNKIASTLERIRVDLGNNHGKLASVGSFGSVGSAHNVLDSISDQLDNIFLIAEIEVMEWMRERIYPSFRESGFYVALAAELDELDSGQLQQRNRFHSILKGHEQSDKILVLEIPNRLSRKHHRTSWKKNLAQQDLKSDKPEVTGFSSSPGATARRRRSSYLFVHPREVKETPVQWYINLECRILSDNRTLINKNKYVPIENIRGNILLQCATKSPRSINRSLEGLLFETFEKDLIEVGKPVSPDSEEESPSEDESEKIMKAEKAQPPSGPLSLLSPQYLQDEKTSNTDCVTSPPQMLSRNENCADAQTEPELLSGLHSHLFPLGLNLKKVSLEGRNRKRHRKPKLPRRATSGNNHIVNIPKMVFERSHSPVYTNAEDFDHLKPDPEIHCFSMPITRAKTAALDKKRSRSKTRFWYGVSFVTYDFMVVECPSRLREKEVSKTEYREIPITLEKNPDYGLGLHLSLDTYGFISIKGFGIKQKNSADSEAKTNSLKRKDVLLSVNDVSVEGRFFKDVIRQIREAPSPVNFVFARGWESLVTPCKSCGYLKCEPVFVFVPKCFALLSRQPCFKLMRSSILDAVHQQTGSTSVESLRTILELNRHRLQREKAIEDVGNHVVLERPIPPCPSLPFHHLFQSLSRNNIMNLVASLMLDRRVLLLSDNRTLLTIAGETLRSLLWPFPWSHFFCPIIPWDEFENIVQNECSDTRPFFAGVCTLDLFSTDYSVTKFDGFSDLKYWASIEQDNLRPLERFLNTPGTEPILEGGTIIVDLDANFVNILHPKPARMFESPKHLSQHPNYVNHRPSTLPDYEPSLEENYSTNNCWKWQLDHDGSIPCFPTSMKEIVGDEWRSLWLQGMSGSVRFSQFHEVLLKHVYSTLLARYKEYYITYEDDTGCVTVAFNVESLLSQATLENKFFLEQLLRSRNFSTFLLESVYTDANVFDVEK